MIEEVIKKLQSFKMTGNHFMILQYVKNKEINSLSLKDIMYEYHIPFQDMNYLIRKGYVEIERLENGFNFDSANITKLGIEVLRQFEEKTDKIPIVKKELSINDWIEDWRVLFSSKKVGAGGSKQNCYKKMELFLKENPKVTKEEIFRATEAYLDSLDNIKYLQQADYFIHKGKGLDASSRLMQWIEVIREEGSIEGNVWDNII